MEARRAGRRHAQNPPVCGVFSANGDFDLATPFFNTEYDIAHTDRPAGLRGNVQFGYYPSGHMI